MLHDMGDHSNTLDGAPQENREDGHADHQGNNDLKSDERTNDIVHFIKEPPHRTNITGGVLPEEMKFKTSSNPATNHTHLVTTDPIGRTEQHDVSAISYEVLKTTKHFDETVEVTRQNFVPTIQAVDAPTVEPRQGPSPPMSPQETKECTSQQSSSTSQAQLDTSCIRRDFFGLQKAAGVREVLDNVNFRYNADDVTLGVEGQRALESAYKSSLNTSTILAYVKYLENMIVGLRAHSKDQTGQKKDNTVSKSPLKEKRPDQASHDTASVADEHSLSIRVKEETNSDSKTAVSSCAWELQVKILTQDMYGRDTIKLRVDEGEAPGVVKHEAKDVKYHFTRRRVFNSRGSQPDHIRSGLKVHCYALKQIIKDSVAMSRSHQYDKLHRANMSIRDPYIVLFQSRRRLAKAAERVDEHGSQCLKSLLDFLKTEKAATWEKLDELEHDQCKEITYQDAWLLYPPGMTVYHKNKGHLRAYKVESVSARCPPEPPSLLIKVHYLHLDNTGTKLIAKAKELSMAPFSGSRSIQDLTVVPESHFSETQMKDKLIRRGEQYWGFRGKPSYLQYSGSAWPTTNDSTQVVIDYFTSSKHKKHGSNRPHRRIIDKENGPCNCPICVHRYSGLWPYSEEDPFDTYQICPRDRWSRMVQGNDKPPNVKETRDHFLFCPVRVWAFSLKHRTWQKVEVESLKPNPVPSDPFAKLVTPNPKYKEVVESMVDTYLNGVQFHDIVKDKGRGLIILLHGSPGTGKTLTAECVAEKKNRPLYTVTCGDLGIKPMELEKNLQDAFQIAIDWKAVLLIDEADVFLQERDLYDVKRNALVSIFLRHLEYYDGLLFLTTNRPGQIDEAFQSRIHITLGLPELDFSQQKKVWLLFLKRLTLDKDKDRNYTKLKDLYAWISDGNEGLQQALTDANYSMNGRQIRNCIRSANAIANKQGRSLQKDDLLTVIKLGQDFTRYMEKVNRMNANDKARSLGYRMFGA